MRKRNDAIPASPPPGGEPLLVTIITPSFNRAALLADTIECVAAQTYSRIDHIVVDGASTDGSVEILQRYEKERGIRWVSESDEGMYEALNKGLRLARGEVVAYLNTDDRYFPYTVEAAVNALLERPHLGFVYSDMLNFDELKKRGSIYFYRPFDSDYLRKGGLIPQPTVFWRREVTEQCGGFDESLTLSADMEYWTRISQTFPGERLEEVLAYEGQHEERLTSGQEARALALQELRAIRNRYSKGHVYPRNERQRTVEAVRNACWYRYSALRFLWFSIWPPRGTSGDRWQGFLQGRHRFKIRRGRLLLALLPFLGRRYKDFISVSR